MSTAIHTLLALVVIALAVMACGPPPEGYYADEGPVQGCEWKKVATLEARYPTYKLKCIQNTPCYAMVIGVDNVEFRCK